MGQSREVAMAQAQMTADLALSLSSLITNFPHLQAA